MPVFYNYTEGGVAYSFDDVFVPANAFREGNLWSWGSAELYGSVGDNTSINKSTPVTTSAGGNNWKQVSTGNELSTAIKTDGTLWTWGLNNQGQLGTNDTILMRCTPVTTFAGGTNWKQVDCGAYHIAAIKTDGTLWTWGRNNFGQLGIDDAVNRCTPVTTFAGGTNWKQVSCGGYHMSAIKTDGTVWTWGRNTVGAIGDNTTNDIYTPVTTFAGGTNWKQVGCGYNITSAIKTDGTLWTWGFNDRGQLGVNNTTTRRTPVTTFAGGTNWKQVAGGSSHTLAIKTDGTLWVWGSNDFGVLGINQNISSTRCTPVTTFAGGTNWKQVASDKKSHTAAIKTDGTLWIWGRNIYGELGNNTIINRSTPVTTFAGGNNWKNVSPGYASLATTYIDSYQ
jgi:alpha-tubulin suppressor-like RCC1 family protein